MIPISGNSEVVAAEIDKQWCSKEGRWERSAPGGTFRGAAILSLHLKIWKGGKDFVGGKIVKKGVRKKP